MRHQFARESAAEPPAQEQIRILAEYAAGIQAIINRDGLQPFRFGALAMEEALDEVDQSLAILEKKGALTDWGANRLARLRTILQLRREWATDLACLRQCHIWLLHAEALRENAARSSRDRRGRGELVAVSRAASSSRQFTTDLRQVPAPFRGGASALTALPFELDHRCPLTPNQQ
ncbi:MAG: hypothetical protein ACLQUY_10835 [Ktedonobacterales bacterium]